MVDRLADEQEFLIAATAGDRKAFLSLVQLHDEALRGLAYSMTGDATAMHDVLQEAYLKAFRSLGSFRHGSSFKTWIYRIVYNAAIDERRRSSRVGPSEQPLEDREAPQVDVDQRMDIDAALAKLPEQQRAVILLVDGEGFDYTTAAQILDVSPGTIASRLNTARATLRRTLHTSYWETER